MVVWCICIIYFRFYNSNIFRISYATSFKTVYDKKCSTHYEKSCHDVGYGYHKERQGASLIMLHYLQIVDTTDNPVLRRRSARATPRRAVMTWLKRFHLHILKKFATKSPNRNVTVCLSKFQRREGSEIVFYHHIYRLHRYCRYQMCWAAKKKSQLSNLRQFTILAISLES